MGLDKHYGVLAIPRISTCTPYIFFFIFYYSPIDDWTLQTEKLIEEKLYS